MYSSCTEECSRASTTASFSRRRIWLSGFGSIKRNATAGIHKLTESSDFNPIEIVENLIQTIISRPWTHLSGAGCNGVNVTPTTLYPFPISPPNLFIEIERIVRLARSDVGGKVKLWNHESKHGVLSPNIQILRVHVKSVPQFS